MKTRIRRWRLILKWTVRHRRWLNRSERAIAQMDPLTWLLPNSPIVKRNVSNTEYATPEQMRAVHEYLADKYDIEEPSEGEGRQHED